MARPPRLLYAGGIYHVIARGNNRKSLFHDKQDFRFYRKLWRQAKKRYELLIHRWCFMTNHVHFIVVQKTIDGLPQAMQYIQYRYAKYYCRRYKWTGHVWQGRYTSRLIVDDIYLEKCGCYVEDNPVKAAITAKPEDYVWSSAYARSRGFSDGLTDDIPNLSIHYELCDGNGQPRQRLSDDEICLKGVARALGTDAALRQSSRKLGQDLVRQRGRSANAKTQ